MRKIIISDHQAPGDTVLLTGAIRDLHLQFPGQFLTDVRTNTDALFENNPYITPLKDDDPDVEHVKIPGMMGEICNQQHYHYLYQYARVLGGLLSVPLENKIFKGDIHLSEIEKNTPSLIHDLVGLDLPFWIINAGGKYDMTTKWWNPSSFQRIVDHFKGQILFIQIGHEAPSNFHPSLTGVVNLKSRTSLRQLCMLMYHASAVITPVSFPMHLSAAVAVRHSGRGIRPCFVIGGGREAVTWYQYPGHQVFQTIGDLDCCREGGCWKTRTIALRDGSWQDLPQNLCLRAVEGLPLCMQMISPFEVITVIERSHRAGRLRYLTAKEWKLVEALLA